MTDPADAMRAREQRARERLYPDEQAYRNDKARAAATRPTQADKATVEGMVAFLRARLDEDEQVGQGAKWFCRGGMWSPSRYGVSVRRAGLISVDQPGAVTGHIARHDPARVLAEVEAKRRIVDEHHPEDGCCRTCSTEDRQVLWDGEEEAIEWARRPLAAPCLTLRLLALPYADHQEYREEWRP